MTHTINHRYIISFVISLFFLNILLTAQQDIKIPNSSLKVGWPGYAEAIENIEKGDKWLKKGKGAIPNAIEFYLKALEYNASCPELNYKIGVCYLNTDQKAKAVSYIQNAYDKKSDLDDEILLNLAHAYHYNADFDKAMQFYNSFYSALKEKKKDKYSNQIFKWIDECKSGKELLTQPKRAVVVNLGDSVNSVYSDYNSVVLNSDSIMYLTSRRPVSKRSKRDRINYFYNEDIYLADKQDGIWRKAEFLDDAKYNTKYHEALVWASDDGKTRYIFDSRKRGGDIYVSYFKKGEWTNPKHMSKIFNSKKKETSMSQTGDGKVLYFVSSNQKENFGGKDIYYSRLNRKGKWDKPKNIGNIINTRFDEECVYITPDGKTLYFSSNGQNSMGGYDIFKSVIDANGSWSKPENLGFPVNTPDNDLFFRPLAGEKKGYFSAMRPDGLGGYDIYQVIFLGAEKQLILRSDEQNVAYFYKPITDFFARISGEIKFDTTYILKGMITDGATNAPVLAKLNLIDSEKAQLIASTITDSTGLYQIRINQLKSYGVEINAKDYMFFLDLITLPVKSTTREFVRNFKLNKIKAGAKIVLKNIYFETGKAVLTSESFAELDKVVSFLQENDQLKIEISGHTDNVGGAAYNVKLSGSRAQAVVDYLVTKGIPREQLVSKGYGPNQPISPNNTAKGRQLNRRVEFKILSTE